MVDFRFFEYCGGIVFWILNGFKGKFEDMRSKQYSAILGFLFVNILIIILAQLF
jgi:hypothetical protein